MREKDQEEENVFSYDILYQIYHLPKKYQERKFFWKQCFLQYLRVQNFLFHISAQQKAIKGPDYFQQEHYGVNSALSRANIKN